MRVHPKQLSYAALRDARDDGSAFCVWSRTQFEETDESGERRHYDQLTVETWCDGERCNRRIILTQR